MNIGRIKELIRSGCMDAFACAKYEKKDAAPPDYGPMAAASEKAAQLGYDLGSSQLDFAKQQYEELKPLLSQIADSQVAAQDQQMQQAQDYYDYQTGTFRPLEQSMVAGAQGFNTDAYRELQAGKAAADVGHAFTTNQAATERAMASIGVNPNSGKYASTENQNNLSLAAAKANAMTGARQQAEQLGWARQLDAVGLGRNLPGASTAAYSGATTAGNSAAGNYMAPGTQYMQGMAQGNSTIMQGQGLQMQGLGNILNSQTSVYNTESNAQGQFGGAVIGAVGTVAAAF